MCFHGDDFILHGNMPTWSHAHDTQTHAGKGYKDTIIPVIRQCKGNHKDSIPYNHKDSIPYNHKDATVLLHIHTVFTVFLTITRISKKTHNNNYINVQEEDTTMHNLCVLCVYEQKHTQWTYVHGFTTKKMNP